MKITPKTDLNALRRHLEAAASNVVGNKMVIYDALLQCREDYMAAAEQAIETHKHWRADNEATPAIRNQCLKETAAVIERCENRLAMIRRAIEELT